MANIIYKLRKEQNKTQNEIAKSLNMAQSNYQRIENADIKTISVNTLIKIAEVYNVSIDYLLGESNKKVGANKIPVLGTIPAGIPIEAIEDIIDYEEISTEIHNINELFALKVKGDSMMPRIANGDVVIVKKQSTCESGDVCVVMVNGFDATLKQVKKDENGIYLVPFNTTYKSMFYDNKQIEELPIRILGKVIELRGKF